MIYVSSSCVRNRKIKDSVEDLAVNGFKNIELSGGTEYYDNFEIDLLELKDKYSLNYICHNYFPPPKKHFVLNLASLNDSVFNDSFNYLKRTILLSRYLGSTIFGFHAGFFIDIKPNEVGKKLSRDTLFNQKKSIDRFCNAFKMLQKESIGISLYIENNVLSKSNSETYSEVTPFMMTNFSEYRALKEKIDFNLLLDVAHLKVSSQSLGLDWEMEFSNMIKSSDYIHISDNDGFHDLNNPLKKRSSLLTLLNLHDTKYKNYTLEIYDNMDEIKRSYDLLEDVVL